MVTCHNSLYNCNSCTHTYFYGSAFQPLLEFAPPVFAYARKRQKLSCVWPILVQIFRHRHRHTVPTICSYNFTLCDYSVRFMVIINCSMKVIIPPLSTHINANVTKSYVLLYKNHSIWLHNEKNFKTPPILLHLQ